MLLSYLSLPWTPKLLYGIITDCFPICGSGKRSYVFIMGMLQATACFCMAFFVFPTAGYVCGLACINSLGGAFMDVVVDGMMVINSRQDPTSGSEELQAYSWAFYGLGGMMGCLISGYFLTGEDANGTPTGNPYICFYIMVFFSAAVGISGLFIDKSLEDNQQDMVQMKFLQRSKFVLSEVGQGLKLKELYSSLMYQTILGAIIPSFGAYVYYY
jgi:MFS family permease